MSGKKTRKGKYESQFHFSQHTPESSRHNKNIPNFLLTKTSDVIYNKESLDDLDVIIFNPSLKHILYGWKKTCYSQEFILNIEYLRLCRWWCVWLLDQQLTLFCLLRYHGAAAHGHDPHTLSWRALQRSLQTLQNNSQISNINNSHRNLKKNHEKLHCNFVESHNQSVSESVPTACLQLHCAASTLTDSHFAITTWTRP